MVEDANVGEEVLRMEIQLEQVDEGPETSTPMKKMLYNPCLKKETKTPGKKPFYYVQKFRKEWLDDEEFQPWLVEVEEDVSKGRCSWCQRDLHARLHEIKRHMNTKKHKLISEQLKSGLSYKKKVSNQSIDSEPVRGGGRKQAHIISILRDLSAIEDNSDPAESPEHMMYEEKENEESIDVADMSDLLKEQVERNNLLSAFISVQKERLELEHEFLDASRKSLSIQEGMLHVLNEKLTG